MLLAGLLTKQIDKECFGESSMKKAKYITDLESCTKISLGSDEVRLLEEHLAAVLDYNQEANLTSIKDIEKARYLQIYDSLLGLSCFEAIDRGQFVDIGSGAGYPGIPLAICSKRSGVLIDSVRKKAILLENMVNSLGLKGRLEVKAMRAEELARELPNSFTIVCARALTQMTSLAELATPLLTVGGHLIAYKGPNAFKELEQLNPIMKVLGFMLNASYSYEIPYLNVKRVIVDLIKIEESRIVLPRKDGFAQKKPLNNKIKAPNSDE